MANHTGKKGDPWSPEEVAALVSMRAQGITRKDIARALNRPISSVEGKSNQIRLTERCGIAPGNTLPRYAVPAARENDDAKHLRLLQQEFDDCGHTCFPVVPTSRPRPLENRREFWRAA